MPETKFGNLNVTKDKNNTYTKLSSVDGKPLLLNNNIQIGVVNAAGNTNAGISLKDRNDGTFRDIYFDDSNVKFKVDGSTTTSLIREDELSTVVNSSGDPLIFSNVHIDMKTGNGGLLNFFDSSVNSNSNAITAPVGIRRNPSDDKMQFRNASSDWIDIPGSVLPLNISSPDLGQILKYNTGNSKWENNNFDIISDITPQLGGNLDTNSKHIIFDDNYGFIDSSNNNKLLIFDDTNSSANFELLISKTLGGPKIAANGTDSNIDLDIHAKGDGDINIVVSGGSTIITKPQINDTSSNHQYIFGVSELAADRTVTLPLLTGNDEFVFKDHAVTLTNKTLTSPVINAASLSGTLSGTPTFSGIGTHSGLDVFNAGISVKNGATSAGFIEFYEDSNNGTNKVTLKGPASADDITLTLPTTTDTLVGRATTDTLTNKTLTSATLTSATLNTGVSGDAILDDDTFASATSTTLATSESIKAYVDAKVQGLDIKDSVRVATISSFTMASTASTSTLVLANTESGFDNSADTLTIDGISLSENDRVLIKDGVNSAGTGVNHKWNGIYTVGALNGTTLTLTRSTDLNEDSELSGGTFTFVEEGAINASCGFVLSTSVSITVGTTPLTFTQFSGAGLIDAGTNLSKIGNTLNVDDSFLKNDASDTTTGTLTAEGGFITLGDIEMATTQKIKWVDDTQYISGTPSGITIESDDTLIVNADTTMTFNAGTSMTVDSPSVICQSSTTNKPLYEIKNTTNDTTGPTLKLANIRGSNGVNDDVAGTINFFTNDNAQNNQNFGQLKVIASAVATGSEIGQMTFGVACSDDGGVDDILTIVGGASSLTSRSNISGKLNVHNNTLITNTSHSILTIKSTNTSDGEAHLNLISDNAANAGDGYQLKSVNGILTIASDHNSSGIYGETIMTLTGHDTDASRTTAITGNLDVSNGVDVTGLLTVSKGIIVTLNNSTHNSITTNVTLDLSANSNFHVKTDTGATSRSITISATTGGSLTGQTGQIIIENLTTNPSTISWTASHGWYFESDSGGSIIVPTLTGTTNAVDVFNYTILVDNVTAGNRKILVTKAAHFQAH